MMEFQKEKKFKVVNERGNKELQETGINQERSHV
jgi:hypothetical protein